MAGKNYVQAQSSSHVMQEVDDLFLVSLPAGLFASESVSLLQGSATGGSITDSQSHRKQWPDDIHDP